MTSKIPGRQSGTQAAEPDEPVVQHKVGKATRVEQAGGAEAVHASARAGTAGAGGALPHLDLIQKAFGKHDIRGVRAHTDGAAAGANAEMGSRAYASGNAIAFGGSVDLHTAAHEAAHVVQQRAGVRPAGGVGTAGDAHEHHADAVADAVVRGDSAEALLSEMIGGAGGGGGDGGVVQHQQLATSGATAGAEAGATGGAGNAAIGAMVLRVQGLAAANNLPGLIALQHELRQQMATDPQHPPEDARAGLATARTWTMDRIAAIRDTYAPRIAAASTGGTTGVPGSGAVEALETAMDGECTPYLNALLEGDPQYRYLHFNTVVSEKVFAAVRLHSTRRGVAQIGHRDDAEAEARAHGHVATAAWCGAFAFTQAEQGGGFDARWVENMQGEGGIRSALAYQGTMVHTWIWDFDHWEGMRDYHTRRGSVRYYETVGRAAPAHGIQPGDLVLIDNALGTNPDHITTAVSFDGRFLTTVGGNQGQGEQGVSRSQRPFDLQANPEPNDVRAVDAQGHRIQEADPAAGAKHTRVHGVGRWSIVDYERHVYVISPQLPTAPPSPAALAERT